jgi:hypothetical protein
MKIRNEEIVELFDTNPLIITGYSNTRPLVTGKSGDDTQRLADALFYLGDPSGLLDKIDSIIGGVNIDEYVAGSDACYIVLKNESATVCFETATVDEEYEFSHEDMQLAVMDWQRAWNASRASTPV